MRRDQEKQASRRFSSRYVKPFFNNDTASGEQRAVINAPLNSVKEEEEEEELQKGAEQTSGAQPEFEGLTSNISGGGATDSYMGFDMSASSSNHGSSYFSAQKYFDDGDEDKGFKAFSTRAVLDNLDASGIPQSRCKGIIFTSAHPVAVYFLPSFGYKG